MSPYNAYKFIIFVNKKLNIDPEVEVVRYKVTLATIVIINLGKNKNINKEQP